MRSLEGIAARRASAAQAAFAQSEQEVRGWLSARLRAGSGVAVTAPMAVAPANAAPAAPSAPAEGYPAPAAEPVAHAQ